MLRRKRGATRRLRCCQAGPENVSLKLSLAPNLVAQPARRIAERESGRQAAFRVPQLVELGHNQWTGKIVDRPQRAYDASGARVKKASGKVHVIVHRIRHEPSALAAAKDR